MQKTRMLDLLPEKKDNLLYQCGYIGDISLSSVLMISEKDALKILPYWIVLKRMTAPQLQRFCNKVRIDIPRKCTKTRESLCKVVEAKYAEWDAVLSNPDTDLGDLMETFDYIDDWNDVSEAKDYFQKRNKLMEPGDEILIMWLTANKEGFSPIIKKTPGAHTHKMLITSWLHSMNLLHEKTEDDPRPTRLFSDTDARTHCLHLRRDSKEDHLDICKQLG